MNTSANDPVRELKSVLAEHLPWNGARIGFLAQFLLALPKVRSISLAELATGFGGPAKVESHYQRLQRFFRGFAFDQATLARATSPPCWRTASSSARTGLAGSSGNAFRSTNASSATPTCPTPGTG